MQEINLIFGARNGEFRITAIMLNGVEISGKLHNLMVSHKRFYVR